MLSNCGAREDSWESLGLKESKAVNPKGNQSWILIGRTDSEAEAPILWPSNVKSQLIVKDPDAGKDWRQEEKKAAEDEMVASLTMDVNLGKLWETVRNREVWHAAVHGVKRVGHDLMTEQQQYEGKSVLHCIRSLKTLLTGSESEKYLF